MKNITRIVILLIPFLIFTFNMSSASGGYFSTTIPDDYKRLSQDSTFPKNTSEIISIEGLESRSMDGNFSVKINAGIYYNPIVLSINKVKEDYLLDSRYILASDIYKVNIINNSKAYDSKKKIQISFNYYGENNGGIYKLEGKKWNYITSNIKDGKISALLSPKLLSNKNNVFGILVDTQTEIFNDIRGHWAKDEITNYIRRDVINGYTDKTFKPDQHITRAEFLVLLSRLYDWNLPYDTSNISFFNDFNIFNKFNKKQISHAFSHKYIEGYPDKCFKPFNHISYKEVDIIMKKILKNKEFKWENYAEKMMYTKKIRSKSYDSYDNNITRAEFSYMLYNLEQ